MKQLNTVLLVLVTYLWQFSSTMAAPLPAGIAKAIRAQGFEQKGIGLYIREVNSDKPIVTLNDDTPLNPASVVKLVTTAAALGSLGSDYHWTNEIRYTGDLKNNTLTGDLYFLGNGDPYLTPERFWLLLNHVSIYGIQNITGNVYFDDSYFQPEAIDYSAFDEQPFRTYNVGPNAVLVGFQATEFHFAVDEANDQVLITPFPSSPNLSVLNKVKLSNGGCARWEKRLTLSTQKIKEKLQVEFNGHYAKSCDRHTLYRRVSETSDHFQHYFLPTWQQLGGKFNGIIARGIVPDNAKLAFSETSISLSEAIRMINKFSNNVMTRQLLLSLGAKSLGPPGDTKKGISAVKTWLTTQQLNIASLQLQNGSGLSRDTRISAALLGQLLYFVYRQAYMPDFIASLPVSGYDGAMAHRFKNEPLTGQAYIKTGLLDFVQTMAGYVLTASGKRFVVVMLHNDPLAHTKAAERLQDDVIRWIYAL